MCVSFCACVCVYHLLAEETAPGCTTEAVGGNSVMLWIMFCWKAWVLAFMRTFLGDVPPSWTLLQTRYTTSWERWSLMWSQGCQLSHSHSHTRTLTPDLFRQTALMSLLQKVTPAFTVSAQPSLIWDFISVALVLLHQLCVQTSEKPVGPGYQPYD